MLMGTFGHAQVYIENAQNSERRIVGFAFTPTTRKDVVLRYALFNLSFVIAAPIIGKLGDIVGRTSIAILSYLIYWPSRS